MRAVRSSPSCASPANTAFITASVTCSSSAQSFSPLWGGIDKTLSWTHDGTVAPAAVDRHVTAKQVEHVDFNPLAAVGADHDGPPAPAQGPHGGDQMRSSRDVEDGIDPVIVRNPRQCIGQRHGLIVDHVVGPSAVNRSYLSSDPLAAMTRAPK